MLASEWSYVCDGDAQILWLTITLARTRTIPDAC